MGETLVGQEYERLDKWIKEVLLNKEEDFDMTRTMLIEVAKGTTSQKEWLEWLYQKSNMHEAITQGIVDPLLLSYFREAEKTFGIPAWFLTAIAFKESSFLVNAENSKTGAYGLMQLIPETQERMVDKLVSQYPHLLSSTFLEEYKNNEKTEHFYRKAVSDPKINIFAGVLCLLEKGLKPEKINWEDNWQEQVLPFLAAYGGFNEVPQKLWKEYDIRNKEEARLKENIFKWAKDEYADEIFKAAERMKVKKRFAF